MSYLFASCKYSRIVQVVPKFDNNFYGFHILVKINLLLYLV